MVGLTVDSLKYKKCPQIQIKCLFKRVRMMLNLFNLKAIRLSSILSHFHFLEFVAKNPAPRKLSMKIHASFPPWFGRPCWAVMGLALAYIRAYRVQQL